MSRVRIATRSSPLALAQARWVAERVRALLGSETELIPVRTTGDRIQDRSLAKVGGKGLFVKEIEEALLEGEADLAVHSAKDLPAVLAPGLALAAFPERVDPRDALIGRGSEIGLDTLPRGARVGTGSLRRRSQLRARRPDLEIVPLRGNVDTRLRKLDEDGLDAIVLASAGLLRLGLAARIHERLAPEVVLPAGGQGVLALEIREGDPLCERLLALDHAPTRTALLAERAFLAGLSGDCHAPIAVLAERLEPGRLRLRGRVLAIDGSREVTADCTGPEIEAVTLGRNAAREAASRGAESLLEQARAEALM